MILKLLNKILISFEIFCMNKDIFDTKNSNSTLATTFFRNEKYLQVEKYFLVQAKCFPSISDFLGPPEVIFVHTQNISYIKYL